MKGEVDGLAVSEMDAESEMLGVWLAALDAETLLEGRLDREMEDVEEIDAERDVELDTEMLEEVEGLAEAEPDTLGAGECDFVTECDIEIDLLLDLLAEGDLDCVRDADTEIEALGESDGRLEEEGSGVLVLVAVAVKDDAEEAVNEGVGVALLDCVKVGVAGADLDGDSDLEAVLEREAALEAKGESEIVGEAVGVRDGVLLRLVE